MMATLPPDVAMVNGSADLNVRLATGGFQQLTVSDVTNAAKTGSSTQVKAISSGFHLQASVTPSTVRAGDAFTLTVKVTNDAGSVIQEINSFVTITVQSSTGNQPGKGTLLTTQFQLLQGQRSVSETYTFAEPIVFVAHDDAGNAPGITNVLDVTPGAASAILVTSNPSWVGGNKHATISARLVDDFSNGIPGQPVTFQMLAGGGLLTPVDSLTDTTGTSRADFLSPRLPETDQLRAAFAGLHGDLSLKIAFVDPNAEGGTITNYPNPFHPPTEPTTLAWVLGDNATVTLRIFTLSGDLVRREDFPSAGLGGRAGLNTWSWDGKNGAGNVVSSGGYIALVEAHGQGETLHVIRRKLAVVR
jgi:hypothetical protein